MRAGELAAFRCSEETIGGERGSPVTPLLAGRHQSGRHLSMEVRHASACREAVWNDEGPAARCTSTGCDGSSRPL